MISWTQRMHRRAATLSNVMTSCGHTSVTFPRYLDKVKFGVPLEEVCSNDIPGPLLVLVLKLNKEAPFKKDVFRAPGYQGSMKKLIHFLQDGRLVNIDKYSVYTIASVLKKFLRKLPGGIFTPPVERRLFHIITLDSLEEQQNEVHRLIVSLPVYTQRLLVLLFGTFHVIASNSERAMTGMTSEALGVSVAPSFFQSCVSDGKTAKMEDVLRFKIATRIMKFLIDNFGECNLFGRENYEFYARITGRILKIEDNYIVSFWYPPDAIVARTAISLQEESQSTPALIHIPDGYDPSAPSTSLGAIPESNLLESCTRLSVSLEENGLFKSCSRSSSSSATASHQMTLEELRDVNVYAESTKSLTYLPQVHERQTERMRTRSEWFLNPTTQHKIVSFPLGDSDPVSAHVLRGSNNRSSSGNNVCSGLSASVESVKRSSIRRSNSRHLSRCNSNRRNKENGHRPDRNNSPSTTSLPVASVISVSQDPVNPDKDCSEAGDRHPMNVTFGYKPRL